MPDDEYTKAINDTISLDEARRIIVAHYASTREWIMPADVNTASRMIRRARLGVMQTPQPPSGLTVAQELDWQRAFRRAVGDGLTDAEADEVACDALGVVRPLEVATERPALSRYGIHIDAGSGAAQVKQTTEVDYV